MSEMDFALKLTKEYGKGYLSYSSIKYALQDMRLFEMKMRDQLKIDSDALTFGKLYDCMLLTPDRFDKQYLEISDGDIIEEIGGAAPTRTKKYKEWLSELQEANPKKELITSKQIKDAQEMIERIEVTGVRELALKGNCQQEFNTFIDEVPVRGFLDVLGDGYITDSKTTAKPLKSFKWAVRDFNYDIQAYIYTKVYGIDTFHWVAQEKKYPYAVGLFTASEDTLKTGEYLFNKAVERIKDFLDNNKESSTDYLIDTI